jgi:hypothetical protein
VCVERIGKIGGFWLNGPRCCGLIYDRTFRQLVPDETTTSDLSSSISRYRALGCLSFSHTADGFFHSRDTCNEDHNLSRNTDKYKNIEIIKLIVDYDYNTR